MADDFSEKLNAILGNPEAMGQIMSIAQALGGGGGEAEPSPPQTPDQEPAGPPSIAPPDSGEAQTGTGPDLSALMGILENLTGSGGGGGNPLSALGDLDPRLIQTGMRLLSEMNRTDDRKTALLTALRPFVKESRYAKVDRAIQIAKLSRVIRVALTLFKEGGGQDHV